LRLRNNKEIDGLNFIKQRNTIVKSDYSSRFSYSDKQAERHLKKLVDLGYIEKKGSGPSTCYEIK